MELWKCEHFPRSLKETLKNSTAYKLLLRCSHSSDKGWQGISALLLSEDFVRILDIITPSKMLTNQKKSTHNRPALLQVAHSLCCCHSPKILVRTDKNMACTLDLKITLCGVSPKVEAFRLHTSVG